LTVSSGKAVINQSSPSYLSINHGLPWQYTNKMFILSVNVINSTLGAQAPLQMDIEDSVEGVKVKGGSWSWRGTRLTWGVQVDQCPAGDILVCILWYFIGARNHLSLQVTSCAD
jgi:hypothetical protein